MGASLSTIPQWSSSPPSQTLNTSMINYDLLNEFIKVLDKICLENPQEAKTEFKRHLEWNTQSLKPSMFENNNLWNVTTSQKTGTKFVVSSSSQKSDGKPIFQLIQIMKADSVRDVSASTTTSYTAKVGSLEYLNKILALCGEHKLMELQEIIQANQDPFSIILGIPSSAFNSSSVDPLVIAFDALNVEIDPKKRDQNQKLYKLLLVLNSFDIQLMKATVKSLEKGKAIDCDKIAEEIEMLQAFCGKEAKCALKNIDWESDYTYTNGQRSPPWRQVFGEICYVDIRPMDKDNIVVTCTRNGIYINKGYWTDEKGNEHLNYNALEGATVFTSLTELMKSYSPHFNATIDKQEYLYHPDENKIINHGAAAAEGNGHSIDNDGNSSEEVQEEETGGKRNAPDGKRTVIKKKSKTVKKNKRAIEPSLKWRALGIKSNETEKPSSKSKIYHRDNGKSDDILNKSKISKNQNNDDPDDSESEYSSEEELQEKRPESELPAEYYQIQKLVKYLRCGNQTATIIAICSLRDFDLKNEFNQCAIKDVGGLDTLVNLLDTNDIKCKIGALQILKEISENVSIRSAICDLDGIRPLVELLKDMDDELKCLAAETISHCAKNSKSRRLVRKYGGIKKLVNLLNITFESKGDERVAISGALALATCSKSAKNKEAIQSAGALPLLSNLLQSKNEKLLIPVVEILQECASDEYYRVAIRSSGMIKFLVENLASDNQELQTHCSSAIFKCAQDDDTRDLVRQHEGLTPLVNLLDNVGNKELLVAATGAVWKCAQNIENVAAFNKLNTIKKLVGLMENQPEDVLVNVVGALGACAKTADGRQGIRESNGITPLVNLLTGTNQNLLVNVTTAVGESALDTDCMAIIDRLDGVRLLWSLLKSANPQVQASAAWAISPCIEHAKDAGEMVRSFVGGLELIVSLLKSDNTEVLASVCAAIANIARDEENLAVITDHGVVPMLAKLTNTRNDNLRRHLAEAIARCCHWGNNRVAFGTANAVSPLVKYLKSPDLEVHRSTARALHQLSMDPDNCITMHEHGVVQLLLGMVGSTNSDLQEAAAGTIGNIRRLALASEKAALTTN